mmetsp:Transcript_21078/g.23432  ORF Transcript_21078/g.23432 Transcript_21078/m.23432 type:complete len:97 (+) Transcript_21078:74-364(+)|eukprot:CAMPEP_0194142794 /NCGR_PEP_ID=MMETSP0152-20130528/12009_1 /TAXON_ID=1049557 /ORGANISM="Thalassiothrix antarctica, Strain L6-D1" /LENGTH=96 /DNA_ID=CAMNT_0038841881 /DNA_START=74 /DNA_END=364 /DNA_ORIENTATION=-
MQKGAQEEDLYGDLEDVSLAKRKKSPKRLKTYQEEEVCIKELQKQIESLDKENRILKRNMGTLFRTAKVEIKRKDAEITALMNELEGIKQLYGEQS